MDLITGGNTPDEIVTGLSGVPGGCQNCWDIVAGVGVVCCQGCRGSRVHERPHHWPRLPILVKLFLIPNRRAGAVGGWCVGTAWERAEMIGARFSDATATDALSDAVNNHLFDFVSDFDVVSGDFGNFICQLVFVW